MDLSISIVSWNTRDVLDQCLKSVYDNTQGIEFEVIVVDNASSDDTVQMVRDKYPQVRLIVNTENVGFARANNQALAVSSGDHFALLNPDTVVQPNALNRLVAFCSSQPQCGACGPMLLNPDETLQPSWAALPSLRQEVLGRQDRAIDSTDYSSLGPAELSNMDPFSVGWLGGACLVVLRSVIDLVGPMDEGYFMYCEETDWCWRIAQAGFGIYYVPSASVVHLGGQSSKQTALKCQLWLQSSKIRLARKRFGYLGALPVAFAGWSRVAKSAVLELSTARRRCS